MEIHLADAQNLFKQTEPPLSPRLNAIGSFVFLVSVCVVLLAKMLVIGHVSDRSCNSAKREPLVRRASRTA